jgi:oligosaccharide repeat unit polymerase
MASVRLGRFAQRHLAKEWWVLVAGIAIALLVGLITPSISDRINPFGNEGYFLLVGLLCFGIMYRERRVRSLGLSPLVIALTTYFVIFSLAPFLELAWGADTLYPQAWHSASLLVVLGVPLVYSGYLLALKLVPPEEGRQAPRRWLPSRARLFAAGLLAVSIPPIVIRLISTGGLGVFLSQFGAQRNILRVDVPVLIAVSLASSAYLLLAGTWLTNRTALRSWLLLGFWLPLIIFVSSTHGSRWRAVALVVCTFALYHLCVKRVRRIAWILIVFGVATVFIVAGGYRHGRQVPHVFSSQFPQHYLATHEVGQFRDLVVTINGVPSTLDFLHGKTFLSLIPGAPYPTGGQVFTSTFFPDLWANGASVPSPLPGEFYMNYGFAGAVIGLGLYGGLLGVLESYYRRNRRHRVGPTLIYAYSLVPVVGLLRGDVTTFLGYPVLIMVPVLLVQRLIEVRAHRPLSEETTMGGAYQMDAEAIPALPVLRKP